MGLLPLLRGYCRGPSVFSSVFAGSRFRRRRNAFIHLLLKRNDFCQLPTLFETCVRNTSAPTVTLLISAFDNTAFSAQIAFPFSCKEFGGGTVKKCFNFSTAGCTKPFLANKNFCYSSLYAINHSYLYKKTFWQYDGNT